MKTLTVDDRQLAVNNLISAMKEIDPGGTHTGLISSHEAVSYAKNNMIDVAFLDIEMPDMNGLVLAKELKTLQPNMNIIFVTGHMEYAYDAHKLYASGYLMKPAAKNDIMDALENLRHPVTRTGKRVKVQCFGSFEVFVDHEPLVFSRSRSKEVFAYLIDSHGAFISSGELIGVLWEDAGNIESRKSQMRSFMADVRNTFNNVGVNDIILKERNSIAVRVDAVDCDYYRFLEGDARSVNMFMGEYMKQYSWAEMRLGELTML